MTKKLSALLLSIALLFSLALTVCAEAPALVVDQIDLLTDEEELALTEKAAALQEDYGMDVVIVTNQSLGGKTPEAYADDYYDYNGYGADGVLFLLSMEFRDWYISTAGDGIYALTDYGLQKLGEKVVPYLGDGEYYEAFDTFLDALVPYFDRLEAGNPIDGHAQQSDDFYIGTQEKVVHYEDRNAPSLGKRILRGLPLSLLIGFIAAIVSILVMRSGMNTKKKQPAAKIYMDGRSYDLFRRRDTFLYSNTVKTRVQESSSSGGGFGSSGGGGGSSVHQSSSGSSHGGGGGKF